MPDIKEILSGYLSRINRFGAQPFLAWLEKSDFWTAPAAARGPLAYPGALSLVVLNATEFYLSIEDLLKSDGTLEKDSDAIVLLPILCGLGHVNFYDKLAEKTYKGRHGVNELDIGRCERALFLAQSFFSLTPEEAQVIRWHDATLQKRDEQSKLQAYVAKMYSNDEELKRLVFSSTPFSTNLMKCCVEQSRLVKLMQGTWEIARQSAEKAERLKS